MFPRTLQCFFSIALLMLTSCSNDPGAFRISPQQSSEATPLVHSEQGLQSIDVADSGPIPNLTLKPMNAPIAESDIRILDLKIEADPAFSHYAYKVGTNSNCDVVGGFTVNEIAKPIQINQGNLADGPVHLCLRGFHAELNRWQPIKDSKLFSWKKVPFQRFFKTYYEYVNGPNEGCDVPTVQRIVSTVAIFGDEGTFTYSGQAPSNCPLAFSGTGSNRIVAVRVTDDGLKATFFEGQISGWLEFKFLDPERTSFTGLWGFGEYGSPPGGVWNTMP